jgi:hypothetical protein
MCVCFGVDWFPHHFFAPEKVQAAFANNRWLVGADVLCRAICVCIECNAPSLKAACTLNLYGKVQAAFFKRKYGKTVHKTAGKIVWNRHYISGKY